MLTICMVTLFAMSRQAEAVQSNEAVLVVVHKLHAITASTIKGGERTASIVKAIESLSTPTELGVKRQEVVP